jgi:hypothetical protein
MLKSNQSERLIDSGLEGTSLTPIKGYTYMIQLLGMLDLHQERDTFVSFLSMLASIIQPEYSL